MLNQWKSAYLEIEKINDIQLNFQAMRTKQQLYKMGVLSLVEQAGGQVQIMNQIREAQKRGDLTNKQAYDLKQAIMEACKVKEGLTVQNEAIKELNEKVNYAVKFYR